MGLMPDVFSGTPITTEDGLHVDTVKPPAPAAAAPAPAPAPAPTPAPAAPAAPAPRPDNSHKPVADFVLDDDQDKPTNPTAPAASAAPANPPKAPDIHGGAFTPPPTATPTPTPAAPRPAAFDYSSVKPEDYGDRLSKEMGRGHAAHFVNEHRLGMKYWPQHYGNADELKKAQDFYEKTHHHILGINEPHAEGDQYKPIYPKTVDTMGEEYYDPKSATHRMIKNYPDEHLHALANGTHGGRLVKMYSTNGMGSLMTEGNGAHAYRILQDENYPVGGGAPTIKLHNGNFGIDDESPFKGHGKQLFANQVAAARSAGIKEMSTNAAGPGYGSEYNGHYTWPRLGYEGKISPTAFRNLPMPIQAQLDGMGKSRSLRALFDLPGGKEAWKKMHIGIVPMTFDLHPESANSKALAKYLAEKEAAKETPPK